MVIPIPITPHENGCDCIIHSFINDFKDWLNIGSHREIFLIIICVLLLMFTVRFVNGFMMGVSYETQEHDDN